MVKSAGAEWVGEAEADGSCRGGGGEGDMVGEVEDECWDKNFWKSEQFFRCL